MSLLILAMVGCDDIVSPCYDCESTTADGLFAEATERTFAVGEGAVIRVDDFAGEVTYRPGDSGTIRVIATRRAEKRSDLDRVEVDWDLHSGGLDITTCNPAHLRRAVVDLEITAPPGAIPRISTGVGNINYMGRPVGSCRFETGVGAIRLRLPADVDITVELSAAVGSIFVASDFDGSMSRDWGVVRGRIGNGNGGDLVASTAVGNIYLIRS